MQIGEGAGTLSLPTVRLLLPRPDPTACLPPGHGRTNAVSMAWRIWVLAATGAFGELLTEHCSRVCKPSVHLRYREWTDEHAAY
jgi:hypothetical protein